MWLGCVIFVATVHYTVCMTIILIAALDENNAIGKNNELPWHLPNDFKFFKRTTLGHAILMGRKTLESMGKPLPGRTNIVITTNPTLHEVPETTMFSSVSAAINWVAAKEMNLLYVIGGGKIFADTINIADEMVLTRVHTRISDAEVFFPIIDHTHWKLTWEEAHPADEKHAYPYTFQHYKRIDL